jgi:hypothetical protein
MGPWRRGAGRTPARPLSRLFFLATLPLLWGARRTNARAVKTILFFALFSLAACGSARSGTWETTTVPADTTSFSEYKQTLTLRDDKTFSRDTKATYTQTSTNPGCMTTILYEGTWSEPTGGKLRFVLVQQKNSTSTACSDASQNYIEADKPVPGQPIEEVDYELTGSLLELKRNKQPWISYKRK